MRQAKAIADYIGGLTIGQGRYAGERFKLLGWQKRFLTGAFGQSEDAAQSQGRGGGKTTFCSAIACATVDVDGPLVEPMAECLLVASSFDQGLIAFRHMLQFLAPSFDKYGTGPRGRFRIIDAERAIAAGLMVGLSPGFTVPPTSAVPDAETLEDEPGNPGVQIRVIREAVLREFSVVTSPAYTDAAVDIRADLLVPSRRRRLWL